MTLPTGAALQATYGLDANCPNADATHAHLPTCIVDDAGNKLGFSYDDNGNLAVVDPPGPLGSTLYEYDSIGRLIEVTDGNGITRTLEYDIRDRLVATTWDAGPATTDAVHYEYDLDGNQLTQTDYQGLLATELVRTYDALGRITTEETPGPAGTTHTLTYDDVGNLLTLTNADGTTTYTYDDADQLLTITQPGGTCPATGAPPANSGCIKFEYDSNGAVVEQIYPGGAQQSTERDEPGRATRITGRNTAGTVFADYSYNYTTGSQDRTLIQSRTKLHGTDVTTTYTYDSLRRLTEAEDVTAGGSAAGDRTWEFDYDDAGNLTRKFTGTTPLSFTANTFAHNASGQATGRTRARPGTPLTYYPITYDGSGNETSHAGASSTWTDRNQLAIRDGVDFTYRGELNDQLLSYGDTDVTNSPIGITALEPPSPARQRITRLPDGTPIGIRTGTIDSYFFTDPVGSVIGFTSNTGNHNGTYEYGPYGDLLNSSTPTSQAQLNPIRYTSGLFIGDTGQYKFGSRYYDLTLARFTQMDPTGQERNPYAYAIGDPINNLDPTGQLSCGWAATAGGLIHSGAWGIALGLAGASVGTSLLVGAGISLFWGAIGHEGCE
ncbi:RHS repeat-associated core domain-containing protein [Jiangella gansuensis]|uniref:RHS repeat-associated core domain-containing protein n=1 Tax=Jiangella gansuensis TaxID=281473 RepID=UPI00047C1230|nr:RHS repeat-associated core domain-containing protein [Jiangella gansuensis]